MDFIHTTQLTSLEKIAPTRKEALEKEGQTSKRSNLTAPLPLTSGMVQNDAHSKYYIAIVTARS